MPFYTIFKDLACRSLCLVPNNIDFVLSCPKCILNLLSRNQSHTLEKSLISCFSTFFGFDVGKLSNYHQHKVTSCWQQLGACNLCKVETRVDVN